MCGAAAPREAAAILSSEEFVGDCRQGAVLVELSLLRGRQTGEHSVQQ